MSELEFHVMWILTFAEGEVLPEVLLQVVALGVFLNGGQQLLVHLELDGFPLVRHLVILLLGHEDVALLLGALLVDLQPAEVVVIQLLGHFNPRDVDGSRGGQQKVLVHAAQRAPVHLKRT